MKNRLLTCLFLLLLSAGLSAQSTAKSYAYTNGLWFNGTEFVPGTWYSQNGVLSKKMPSNIDSTIDLGNRWVVPPMGDAFSSCLSDNSLASYASTSYLKEGVFYVQVLTNTAEDKKALEGQINNQKGPDVQFANGAITCNYGMPFLKYEALAMNIRNPKMIADRYDEIKHKRDMLGNGYWFINSKEDLDKNWKKIEEQKPNVISIYLLDAENSGGNEGKGLKADVAKLVIKKAHKAKIQVYAHVETAADVRLGLKLGVDGFANFPGESGFDMADKDKYTLSDEDLKKLAKKKTPIIPLMAHLQTNNLSPEMKQFQVDLFKRMLANNVTIAIGSDDPQRTTRTELNYWFQLEGLSNLQSLKILCENTPKAIYPKRKIGKIEDGYEASFLVLNDNPLDNILKIRVISFVVKNGIVIRTNQN